ncbi:MAG: phosphatidate cytidylyltransferase [Anaerolineae bacterium]|nr:phosphatidate cytidylyltransferase [Anaerolineae bacterium]
MSGPGSSGPTSSLIQRLISSIIIFPIVLGLLALGGWWFSALVLVVMSLATWEYVRMLRHHGYRAPYAFAILALWAILSDFYFPDIRLLQPTMALLLFVSLCWHILRDRTSTRLENWLLPFGGALYIGWMAGHMLLLRALDRGGYLVFLSFAAIWLADSAAYFVGRAWGKHRMAPHLSPKKTWEGMAGGIVVSIVGSAIIAVLGSLNWVHGALLGLLVSTLAPMGDLGVSMIKRQVGVKDTSNLIPGHGGVFDRIDSLLIAAIVGYYYIIWVMQ